MYLYIISLHCSFIPSIVLATTENNTMINIILIIVIAGFSGISGNLVLALGQCIVLKKYLILFHWDQKTITPMQTNQIVHTLFVCKDWLLLYKRAIEFAWLPSKYQYWITTEWRKNSIEFNLVSFAQHVGVKNICQTRKFNDLNLCCRKMSKNKKVLVFCIYLFQRIKRHRKLVVILANRRHIQWPYFQLDIPSAKKKEIGKGCKELKERGSQNIAKYFCFKLITHLFPYFWFYTMYT